MEYSALFQDEYANAMGMMYEGHSEFLFELDRAAQAFVPPVAASEVFAGRVVADGNCFFLGSFSQGVWNTGASFFCNV